MKKNKSIIIIVIGEIILVLGILFLPMFGGNKKENDTNIDDKKDEPKEEVTVDSNIVRLTSNLISVENDDIANSFFVYQNKKVNVGDIDSKVYYGNALNEIEMNDTRQCTEEESKNNPDCDFVVSSEVLLNKIKELYGDSKGSLPQRIDGDTYLSCVLNNGNYECLNHPEEEELFNDYIDYFTTYNYLNANKIIKAEKDSKYLYIYEKYINLRIDKDGFDPNNLDTYIFSLYKYSNTNDLLSQTKVIGKDYYKDKSVPFKDKLIEEFGANATTFKHTFKIVDKDNYLYVSTEEVK